MTEILCYVLTVPQILEKSVAISEADQFRVENSSKVDKYLTQKTPSTLSICFSFLFVNQYLSWSGEIGEGRSTV